jgi:Domain of unknown function (DUF4440)
MDKPPIDFFVDLETQVWEALVRGDADADRALLTSDFVGVYATGFADRSVHAAQLVEGPTVDSYSISDTRLIRVSATAVVLCYRADYRPVRTGRPGGEETMFVSSLWTAPDGQWLNGFSQDTPAASQLDASDPGS